MTLNNIRDERVPNVMRLPGDAAAATPGFNRFSLINVPFVLSKSVTKRSSPFFWIRAWRPETARGGKHHICYDILIHEFD